MKQLKRPISLLCALAMLFSLAACGGKKDPEPDGGIYTPGTYEGTAQGFGGTVTVKVTVDANSITDVVVEGPEETETIGGAALPELQEQIKTAQSAEIDGVSGATMTSNAAKAAAADAIAKAKGEEVGGSTAAMKAGTYTAAAKGQNGEVSVSVTVDESSIKSIEVTDHTETYGLGWGLSTSPIETLPTAIVANQSLAVDSVTSATVTSMAIKAAVTDCITQAGGDPAAFQAAVEYDTADETYDTDILVVGAGAAGLAAALSAQEAGAKVMIMEKTGVTGGSTTRSGGKVLGAGTKWQADQDFTDNAKMMYDYLMSFDTDGLMNADLVKQFSDDSLENIMWLSERGVPFINVEPIHSSITPWRVHNVTGGGGQTSGHGGQIMVPLTTAYENNGGKIIYNCAATELITKDGAVVGVVGEKAHGGKVTVNAKNVILCTGGFAHSDEYMAAYTHFLPSNAASGVPMTNVGDGLRMATAIGAKKVENPGLQLVYVNYDCYIGINEESGLIVDINGERFVDEWTYQSHVASAAGRRSSPAIYYITATKDGACAEPYPMVQWGVTIESPNFSYKASSIEELATLMDVDAENLVSTVERYNALCAKGNDEDFGKPADYMIPVEGDTYYAFKMLPGSSVTFGGLQLNGKAQVLDTEDQPIPGLYAAGEVAFGGLFGDEYPCCGMAIGSAVYFGRTAVETILNGDETPEETPAPAETTPVESAKPSETPKPAETTKPSEAPKPSDTPKPEPTPEPTPEPVAGIYNPGTYSASSFGFGGDVTVSVTVDDNNIVSVSISGPDETESIGRAALPTLESQAKSGKIDGVSGASVTSGAAKEALEAALKKAKR